MVMPSMAVPGRITGSEGEQASGVKLYQYQDVVVMSLRPDRIPHPILVWRTL
jgi:hypothetical protein